MTEKEKKKKTRQIRVFNCLFQQSFGTKRKLAEQPIGSTAMKVLPSSSFGNRSHLPVIIRRNSFYGSSYPEGNFGVNQLLDGSMGLSPLYPALTSDLHVNTAMASLGFVLSRQS